MRNHCTHAPTTQQGCPKWLSAGMYGRPAPMHACPVTAGHLCSAWRKLRSWDGGAGCCDVLALQTETAAPPLASKPALMLIHSALPGNLLRGLDAHCPCWLHPPRHLQRLQQAQGLPVCPERVHWWAGRQMGCGRAPRQLVLRSGHLAPRWRAALHWQRPLPCPYLGWTSPICPVPAADMEQR